MTEDLLRFSIAVEVMSIEVYQAGDDGYKRLEDYDERVKKYELYHWVEGRMIPAELPNYLFNIKAAWQVIEKMRSNPNWLLFSRKLQDSYFWQLPEKEASTKICLLALGVVKGY